MLKSVKIIPPEINRARESCVLDFFRSNVNFGERIVSRISIGYFYTERTGSFSLWSRSLIAANVRTSSKERNKIGGVATTPEPLESS